MLTRLLTSKYDDDDVRCLRHFFNQQASYYEVFGCLPFNGISFDFNGIQIRNPFFNEKLTKTVDPFVYYGQPFVDIVDEVLERY